MKETVSKRKAKRACIDCHFLAEEQNDTEEAGLEPYEMEPKICHYYVEADRREPIKRNDYSWIQFPLVCYRGCWRGCNDKEKQHEEVVEIDRNDCPLFFEYKQGMSYEAAEKIQDKMAVLEAREQSNKTESEKKAKRACIDCHFLASSQLQWWGHPKYPTSTSGHFELGISQREQARRKEDITIEWCGHIMTLDDSEHVLTCYKECWTEFNENITKKRYGLIVGTDRSECIYFFEYRPSMAFKVADEFRKEAKLLQSSQNKSKSNKTETVAYEWNINNTRDVFCNEQYIAKLPYLQFKLFKCLHKKAGKYVRNETLKKCWGDKKPSYKNYLSTEMSKIGSKLKTGLEENNIKINGNVIEPKQEKKKNIAYKLVT